MAYLCYGVHMMYAALVGLAACSWSRPRWATCLYGIILHQTSGFCPLQVCCYGYERCGHERYSATGGAVGPDRGYCLPS